MDLGLSMGLEWQEKVLNTERQWYTKELQVRFPNSLRNHFFCYLKGLLKLESCLVNAGNMTNKDSSEDTRRLLLR